MSSLNCISTLILTLLAKKNKQKHLSGSCGMSCFQHKGVGSARGVHYQMGASPGKTIKMLPRSQPPNQA